MIIANTATGGTLRFDVRRTSDAQRLADLLSAGAITALAIHHAGQQSVLPLPRRFRERPAFGAEVLWDRDRKNLSGERIYAQVADVRVSLTLSYSNRMLRCDLERTGRMRYNPTSTRRSRT